MPSSNASWLVKNSVARSCGTGLGIDAAGAHEVQSLGDAVGKFLVTLAAGVLEETKGPADGLAEIGVTALGEGAQQI